MGAIMKSRLVFGLFAGLSLASTGALAQAGGPPAYPPAPPPAVMSDAPPESAFLLQVRMQTQQGLLSLVGASPGFLVGYQLKGVALGVGFGFSRVGVSTDNNGGSVSASLFQVTPTLIVDVWHSRDQRTRANLVGSVGYGRASVTIETPNCTLSPLGVQTCTTSESKSSATLIPVQIGFGGDHFLSRYFGIGAEAGVQLMFVSGLESNGQSANGSVNAQTLYGLLRMTLLLGE
jgi:hypothetical protein